ncbi:MAG: hypothetical protein HC882_00825 [Acidobacteria bacterium]|nr:hypothetical protein [Acidobacteriota bacterium]
MKFYVAGASAEWQRARRVMDELEKFGHYITYDWTESFAEGANNSVLSLNQAIAFSSADQDAVARADVLLLLVPSDGLFTTGAWTELGVMRECIRRGETREIWIVGSWKKNIFMSTADRMFDDDVEMLADAKKYLPVWAEGLV